MKITLMEPLGIPQTVLDGYRSKLETAGHTFVSYASKTADPAEQAARVADSDAVIIANTPFPAPVILGAPNLKFIDVAFTGIDHVGLDACRQKGVTLSNAAGYSTQCVAELALGLAVACLRFVPACDAASGRAAPAPPFVARRSAAKLWASWAPVPSACAPPGCSWPSARGSSPIPAPAGRRPWTWASSMSPWRS